ncbi:MAG: sugar kinase [Lysobacterales bacterium 63-13]|nr:MAG: sugar kinase [Xanthomonadales bacterium 63-13]
MSAEDRKIVLVTRRTRLEDLVRRHNTVEQARFQAEHSGQDFGDFIEEDRIYRAAVARVAEVLDQHGRLQRLDRDFLANFLFPPNGLIVVLGQDGLVANTLKYLDGQPVLAINPDPARWEGVLLPFGVEDVAQIIAEVLKDKRATRSITMARAELNDGQQLLAVNDFFIGARTHVSARYEISLGNHHERHSSSGVIVSTGLGSTGWLKSVLTGAGRIAGEIITPDHRSILESGLPWESESLVFSVREPYPSRTTQVDLTFGRISARSELRLRSLMPENGVIFSDGMEADGLEFRSGIEVRIGVAQEHGALLY